MINTTQEKLDQELKLDDLTEVSGALRLKNFRPQQKLQRRLKLQRRVVRPFGSSPVDQPMCW